MRAMTQGYSRFRAFRQWHRSHSQRGPNPGLQSIGRKRKDEPEPERSEQVGRDPASPSTSGRAGLMQATRAINRQLRILLKLIDEHWPTHSGTYPTSAIALRRICVKRDPHSARLYGIDSFQNTIRYRSWKRFGRLYTRPYSSIIGH